MSCRGLLALAALSTCALAQDDPCTGAECPAGTICRVFGEGFLCVRGSDTPVGPSTSRRAVATTAAPRVSTTLQEVAPVVEEEGPSWMWKIILLLCLVAVLACGYCCLYLLCFRRTVREFAKQETVREQVLAVDDASSRRSPETITHSEQLALEGPRLLALEDGTVSQGGWLASPVTSFATSLGWGARSPTRRPTGGTATPKRLGKPVRHHTKVGKADPDGADEDF